MQEYRPGYVLHSINIAHRSF